jgi:putative tricarboxylic transport membrane protein
MIERRRLLLGAAALPFATLPFAAMPLGATARAQGAQRYASMTMFIPAGPGGGWDGLGRAIEQVARQTGMVGSMQFENVGGAGGVVGLPRFIQQRRGRPDALMVAGAVMVGSTLTNRSPVGMKDITPLARMTDEVGVIVVPANSEYRDIRGLLDAMRANPGAVAVGGGSAGGVDHILLGQMLKALGRNAREASYVAFAGGGPAQAAILGGQVRAGISGFSEFAEQIKAGRMRALATSGETRSDPAIPHAEGERARHHQRQLARRVRAAGAVRGGAREACRVPHSAARNAAVAGAGGDARLGRRLHARAGIRGLHPARRGGDGGGAARNRAGVTRRA